MSKTLKQRLISNLPYWILLAIVVLWSIVPIYIVISSSIKIPREIFGYPPTFIPTAPTLSNFQRLWRHLWIVSSHCWVRGAMRRITCRSSVRPCVTWWR